MTIELNKIYNEDFLSGIQNIPDSFFDICVTSPPYNLNIKYGKYNDNLSTNEYLQWMDNIFCEIKRVLKPEGNFFLNVGYSNIDPWVSIDVANIARKHFVLQNNIIWVKSIHVGEKTQGHFKPINSNRFLNPTWENLFHFTKTGSVPIDRLAIGVPYTDKSNIERWKGTNNKDKRCLGNSWFMPYETITNRKKYRGNHPATFPVKLVDNCIKISGITTGILLDPFMGSGSSAIAAIKNNIDYIGYEIDSSYIDFAEDRIKDI